MSRHATEHLTADEISAYCFEKPSPDDAARIEEHVETCADCAELIERILTADLQFPYEEWEGRRAAAVERIRKALFAETLEASVVAEAYDSGFHGVVLPDAPQPVDRSTVDLILAYQAGDEGAVEVLFERYLPRARAIAKLRVPEEASRLASREDIVQDAMIRAFQNIKHFDTETEGTFRDYLARCIETAWIDAWRAAHRSVRDESRTCYPDFDLTTIVHGQSATPSAVASAAELNQRIESALLSMDSIKRELIIQRAMCGKSYDEIASELGLNPNAVKTRFCRAMQELESAVGF